MIKTTGMTDTGKYRSNNEDAFRIENNVLVVADGMGGAAAGEVASRIAVTTVANRLSDLTHSTDQTMAQTVTDVFFEADAEIRRKTLETPDMRGMGTTAVLALPFDRHVLIANIGDSRVYLLSGQNASPGTDNKSQNEIHEKPYSAITRVTIDHSVVMELVRSEIIKEEDIRTHPLRNRITRCLGNCDNGPDIGWLDVEHGDGLLLCSDGLWEMVHEDLLLAICNASSDTEEMCARLIAAANDAGGVDNITVIAAQFQ